MIYTDITKLQSNADCALYAYGVGDSSKQATPRYMRDLAGECPQKTFELVLCDASQSLPACLSSYEWTPLPSSESTIFLFKHKFLPNLRAKLISQLFPVDPAFDAIFQKYIYNKLNGGQEVFLGVHNTPFTDMQCCLGETYNKWRGKFPDQIHFYIQCGEKPALVYRGAYSPLMGLFLRAARCSYDQELWASLQRVFSGTPASSEDLATAREAATKFLEVRKGVRKDANIEKVLNTAIERDLPALTAPEEELYRYIDNPLQNHLIMIPLERLTPQIWNTESGQKTHWPSALKTYLGLVILANVFGTAFWHFTNWNRK